MDTTETLHALAANNGIQSIGAAQRTIAFSAVASGGTGKINVTTATHNLKKGNYVNITGGAYAGTRRVLKIISPTIVQLDGTFGATAAGTLELTAAKDIYGFFVDAVPLTISAIEPENANIDTTAYLAKTFVAGTYESMPCKLIRLSAGNITVIPKAPKTDLPYGNR